MNLNQYQQDCSRFNLYPDARMLFCLTSGLVSEVGEVFGKFNKIERGDVVESEAILQECGDCLWFVGQLILVAGFGLAGAVTPFTSQRNYSSDDVLEMLSTKANHLYKYRNHDLGGLEWNSRGRWEVQRFASEFLDWLQLLVRSYGSNLEEVADLNFAKLTKREAEAKLRGDGDNR